MPRKNIPMYLSSKNTQTTAFHRFHAIRQNPKFKNFQMNTGCCGNRNPLIGWRKEGCCKEAAGWQEVLMNVNGLDCCKPKLRMVQNRGRSSKKQTDANGGRPYNVSGKIDKSYNHNYRQYLKKRCMIASYDRASGRQLSRSTSDDFSTNVFDGACCTTNCDCDGSCAPGERANVTTYKRNNWNFRKQGAVDNNLYMTRKVQQALNVNEWFEDQPCPCVCDPCTQIIIGREAGGDHMTSVQPGDVIAGHLGDELNYVYGILISKQQHNNDDHTWTLEIHLDDCEQPFLEEMRLDHPHQGDHTHILHVTDAGEIVGGDDTACESVEIPVRRRPPPQYVEDNPKNYNHGTHTFANNH